MRLEQPKLTDADAAPPLRVVEGHLLHRIALHPVSTDGWRVFPFDFFNSAVPVKTLRLSQIRLFALRRRYFAPIETNPLSIQTIIEQTSASCRAGTFPLFFPLSLFRSVWPFPVV